MAQCLSNFRIVSPNPISSSSSSSSQRSNFSSSSSRTPQFFCNPIGNNSNRLLSIRADAGNGNGNGRDNLDYLQRSSTNNLQQQQQQQQQIKKRVPNKSAPIGLWDRFPTARTVQQMMDTMDRLMDDPLAYGSVWAAPLPSETTTGYGRGRTPWEIIEAENEYKMRFDMPGMTKEDVKVWVEEKMLVVKAAKESKKAAENGGAGEEENGGGGGAEWSAKSYGKYSSRIALPENIQFEKIKAEVKDGVLYISVPKASVSSKVLDINVQ